MASGSPQASAGAVDAAGMSDPATLPILHGDNAQPTYEPSAGGFADGLRRLPALHLPYHSLSTTRHQPGILVHVHPVFPWNLKLQQPQLPRFEPDGQPVESSHLATWPATRRMRTLSFFPVRLRTRQDVLSLSADGNITAASGRPALLATKSVPRIHGQRSRLHRKLNPEWSFLQCLSKSAPLQESRGRSDATTQRRCE